MNCSTALATYPQAQRAASMLAYLVLLQVEVAAFHPACPALANGNKRTRLCGPIPRLHRRLAPAAYNGRVLPATLLYGARTFLYARHRPPYHWQTGFGPRTAAVWPTSRTMVARTAMQPAITHPLRGDTLCAAWCRARRPRREDAVRRYQTINFQRTSPPARNGVNRSSP